jgi:hypothetical protein
MFDDVEEIELVVFVVAIHFGDPFDVFERVGGLVVQFAARFFESVEEAVAPLRQPFDTVAHRELVAGQQRFEADLGRGEVVRSDSMNRSSSSSSIREASSNRSVRARR